MKSSKSFYLFLFILFVSCNNPSTESNKSDSNNETKEDRNKAKTDTIQNLSEAKTDSILNEKTENEELISVQQWKTEDFIVSKQFKSSATVKRNIEYTREDWKNVKSPFIATFQGTDIGDYFHLTFEDAKGKIYDFGFGENQLGDYELYKEPDDPNPKYLGKTFKIYWNWKVTTFPCCDGEYDQVEAYLPAITRLELVESGTK